MVSRWLLGFVVVGYGMSSVPEARASSCYETQHFSCCPHDDDDALLPQSVDFAPWVAADWSEADAITSQTCLFRHSSDGVEVPASITVDPMSEPDVAALHQGCNTDQRFGDVLVRFIPQAHLENDSTYDVFCDEEPLGIDFRTGSALADPPPQPRVVEVDRGSPSCDGVDRLTLDIEGLGREFFATGGMIVLRYDDRRIDYAHTPSTLYLRGEDLWRLPFWLPLDEDDVLMLHAVNGAGVQSQGVPISVAGLGADDEVSRCSTTRSKGDCFALLVVVLVGAGLRRRSRRCG